MADRAKEGNVGNEMPTKVNDRRPGADPPMNESGRTTAPLPSRDARRRYVRAGSGSCITAASLSNAESFSPSKVISDTRSWHLSAAMMFLMPPSVCACQGKQVMAIGKDGHIPSEVVVGVLPLQASSRCRWPGDVKTMRLHRRHTWASVFHHHVKKYS